MSGKKKKDLFIISVIYIVAFLPAFCVCCLFENEIVKYLVFDVIATIIVFAFSVICKNSSVYDPYWSLTPMVMSIALFYTNRAFLPMQLLFFIVFNLWSARLTLNWVRVFTDFSYEDWRYKKFRAESSKFFWVIANFFGIHMMPTIVVFIGMLPLFEVVNKDMGFMSIPGLCIMLFGIMLEFFADKQMGEFLSTTKTRSVCKNGLWKYSRHPNYLGEILFWVGVFMFMLPYSLNHWYYGIGCLSVFILFNVVSIPLMEKRQLSRRSDYASYMTETSRLFLWPSKV